MHYLGGVETWIVQNGGHEILYLSYARAALKRSGWRAAPWGQA